MILRNLRFLDIDLVIGSELFESEEALRTQPFRRRNGRLAEGAMPWWWQRVTLAATAMLGLVALRLLQQCVLADVVLMAEHHLQTAAALTRRHPQRRSL